MPPQYNPRLRRLEEYEQIKRKNRRRLVGAVLMAGVAAVLLSKVLGGGENTEAPASVTVSDSGTEVAASSVQVASETPPAETVQAAAEDSAPAPAEESPAPAGSSGKNPVQTTILPNPLNPDQPAAAPKPAEAAPRAENKPVEPKPAAPKPVEAKPAEAAPKPAATPPADNTPPARAAQTPKPAENRQAAKPTPPREQAANRSNRRQNDSKAGGNLSPEDILNNRAARQAERTQTDPQAILNGRSETRTMIQVGAYTSEDQARAVQKRLADAGVSAYVAPAQSNGNQLYRVRTGTYANAQAANQSLAKIKALGLDGMLLER